jgi:hypothetical protein
VRLIVLVILTLLSFAGCSWGSRSLDAAGAVLTDEFVEYCGNPKYRREALYYLLNGALEPHGIEVGVICPGDEE